MVQGSEWIALCTSGGYGNGSFCTAIAANIGAERSGLIEVSADGCETIFIPVVQDGMHTYAAPSVQGATEVVFNETVTYQVHAEGAVRYIQYLNGQKTNEYNAQNGVTLIPLTFMAKGKFLLQFSAVYADGTESKKSERLSIWVKEKTVAPLAAPVVRMNTEKVFAGEYVSFTVQAPANATIRMYQNKRLVSDFMQTVGNNGNLQFDYKFNQALKVLLQFTAVVNGVESELSDKIDVFVQKAKYNTEADIIAAFNIHLTQENKSLTAYMNSAVTAKWSAPAKKIIDGYMLSGYLIEISTTANGVKQYASTTVDAELESVKMRLNEWKRVDGGTGIEETKRGAQPYLWSVTPIIKTPDGRTVYGHMSAFNLTVYAAKEADAPKGLDVEDVTASWDAYKGNGHKLRLVGYKKGENRRPYVFDYPLGKNAIRQPLETSEMREKGQGTFVAELYAVYSESLYDGCVYTYVESKSVMKEFTVVAWSGTDPQKTISSTLDSIVTWESPFKDEERVYTTTIEDGKLSYSLTVNGNVSTSETSKGTRHSFDAIELDFEDEQLENLVAVLDDYEVGTYFNAFGDKPCVCHKTPGYPNGYCGYAYPDTIPQCTCVFTTTDGVLISYYDSKSDGLSTHAVQCNGYARYVYYKLFGHMITKVEQDSSKNTVSGKANIKQQIINAGAGTYIRVNNHSFIVLHADSDKIIILESNHNLEGSISKKELEDAYGHAYNNSQWGSSLGPGCCRITIRQLNWSNSYFSNSIQMVASPNATTVNQYPNGN